MKITSVRKDKMGCKVDDNWYMFTPAVKNFIGDKQIYGKEVDIETNEDGKMITKLTIKESEQPKEKFTSFNAGNDTIRNRSMALSYAKDLWVADKIERKDVLELAEVFKSYMENGITEGQIDTEKVE